MKNLLVVSGTASEAFGCVSMTKTKPITAHYQCQFRRTDWEVASLPINGQSVLHTPETPSPYPQNQRTNRKAMLRSVSPLRSATDAGLAAFVTHLRRCDDMLLDPAEKGKRVVYMSLLLWKLP